MHILKYNRRDKRGIRGQDISKSKKKVLVRSMTQVSRGSLKGNHSLANTSFLEYCYCSRTRTYFTNVYSQFYQSVTVSKDRVC